MALSSAGKHAGIPRRAFEESIPYNVALDADESAVAVTHQSGSLVTGVVRSSDGIYVLTLSHLYKRIVVKGVNIRKNGDWAGLAIVAEGATDPNTITVYTYLAGTLDDPDVDVDVSFDLVTARHHPSGEGAR